MILLQYKFTDVNLSHGFSHAEIDYNEIFVKQLST